MANNRELSQFADFLNIDEGVNNNVGIATTVRISGGGGVYVGGIEVISPTGVWKGPGSGLIGAQGTAGAQGDIGATGTQGAQGIAGAQGAIGATGAQGAQGASGTLGSTGAQGAQGIAGAQGAQGTAGSQGSAGIQGAQGASGSSGSIGVQGSAGAQGAQGATGAQGAQGVAGTGGSITNDTTTASDFFPIMTSSTSGALSGVTISSTKLFFRPSTGQITSVDFNSTSDQRLKTNIKPILSPLSKLLQINGVSFNWIEDNQPALGVIAQEIEKVFPELVTQQNDHKTVKYNGLIGVLIEAVKELAKEVEELKKQNK